MTELAIHAADQDIAEQLCEQIRSAYAERTPLRIVGGRHACLLMAVRWKAKR